ncbi:arylamine N-acetyltransferase [Paenibacillus sepulcri]|uniref:arylamine N-acetyltransferase n=1 Tax=Paenibacillus sepulcri TaxID=359917 RepID=UPI0035EB40A6
MLTRGGNYDRDAQRYLTLGRSHISFLLVYEGRLYLLDTGFGAYLPLMPVPLIGDTVDGPRYRDYSVRASACSRDAACWKLSLPSSRLR